MDQKEKLREKLRKKNKKPVSEETFDTGGGDIVKMMEQINKILKTNPDMVQQISKCVSNVMNNKDLMESITTELESQIKTGEPVAQDQTLQSNSEGESLDASEKESTQ